MGSDFHDCFTCEGLREQLAAERAKNEGIAQAAHAERDMHWKATVEKERAKSKALVEALEAIRHEAKDALTWGRANAALAAHTDRGEKPNE
jgi:hypothetical protein